MAKTRILIIDDEPKLRILLRRCFESAGYAVSEASDLMTARAQITSSRPNLITLDIRLGNEDGFVVIRDTRATSQVPIIMVTGRDDIIDRVVGLEQGADDYITKPFHVREVLARVKSVLRRTQSAETASACDRIGVCSCETSLGEVINFDGIEAIPDSLSLLGHTIDNRVARLRKRIERDPKNPVLVKTIRGVGYSLCGKIDPRAQTSTKKV